MSKYRLSEHGKSLAQLVVFKTWRQELLAEVERQRLDDAIWFKAETAPEAYLQERLIELHDLIIGEPIYRSIK
jgi:hypothetical protein